MLYMQPVFLIIQIKIFTVQWISNVSFDDTVFLLVYNSTPFNRLDVY